MPAFELTSPSTKQPPQRRRLEGGRGSGGAVGEPGEVFAQRCDPQEPPTKPGRFNRRLALALNTTADQLVFDNEPNTTTVNMWQLRLEALTHLGPDERQAIRTIIDSVLLRHRARKLAS